MHTTPPDPREAPIAPPGAAQHRESIQPTWIRRGDPPPSLPAPKPANPPSAKNRRTHLRHAEAPERQNVLRGEIQNQIVGAARFFLPVPRGLRHHPQWQAQLPGASFATIRLLPANPDRL